MRVLSDSARTAGIVLLLLFASAPTVAGPSILTGHARVIDGDTIEITDMSIRLKGIAAPERDEPGGRETSAALRRLIGSRAVRCALTGERTRGREVGYCSAGGVDLNAAMVKGGWALSCPRYSTRYVGSESASGVVQRSGYRLPSYCVGAARRDW